MSEAITNLSFRDLVDLPVHGPDGRIAAVRGALGLRQVDLAKALVAAGGRASRETVSKWENLDDDGIPRARMTRRNAAALAELCRPLGLDVGSDLFYEPDETAWDRVDRRQLELAEQMRELVAHVDRLERELKKRR